MRAWNSVIQMVAFPADTLSTLSPIRVTSAVVPLPVKGLSAGLDHIEKGKEQWGQLPLFGPVSVKTTSQK